MTYLQHYEDTIEPRLQAIDIFVKTQAPFTTGTIADLLGISETEIHNIISNQQISQINKMNFFSIMMAGSSQICQLFRKELERGTFNKYSLDDISYIYNIPYNKVWNASKTLDCKEFSSTSLRKLFAHINMD